MPQHSRNRLLYRCNPKSGFSPVASASSSIADAPRRARHARLVVGKYCVWTSQPMLYMLYAYGTLLSPTWSSFAEANHYIVS